MDSSTVDEQIRQWARDYARLFEEPNDGVIVTDEEQIPPREMDLYINKYKKLLESEGCLDEAKRNLIKLKKINEGWQLNSTLVARFVECMERKLSKH